MAAEPETLQPPPELPIATAPSAPEETAADPTTTTAQQQPAAENPGPPPLAPKRQRRPSVRLGEIGDQRASATNHETHTRRPSMPPWSWRIRSKEPSRTNSKARSLTNLPNGGEEIAEFGNKRGKSKRASTATKRVRSNFAPRTTVTTAAAAAAAKTENNNNDNGEEEAYRDFDYEQEDEDYHDDSPVHSVHDDDGYWHIGRHTDRARVSENDVVESDSREGRKCEGVRSWLLELGLSRYAPMFEIHEVDDELLPMLTLEDLKDMGINAVGSRRKMYTAIQKLRKGFP